VVKTSEHVVQRAGCRSNAQSREAAAGGGDAVVNLSFIFSQLLRGAADRTVTSPSGSLHVEYVSVSLHR